MARITPRPVPTEMQTLKPLLRYCPTCGETLWAAYHNYRTITTLDAVLGLTLQIRRCLNQACPHLHQPHRPEKHEQISSLFFTNILDVDWKQIHTKTGVQGCVFTRQGATDRALDVIADLHQMRDIGAAIGPAGNISGQMRRVCARVSRATIATGSPLAAGAGVTGTGRASPSSSVRRKSASTAGAG